MERRMVERQIRMIVRQRKNRKKNDRKTKEERLKKYGMTKKNDGKKKE